MKGVFLFLVLSTASLSAFADDANPTCELQGNHWYNSANLGEISTKPMSYEECLARGEKMFNSTVPNGTSFIRVAKNQITERSWTEKFKSVKIKYYADDGSVIKTTLKRTDSEKSAVTKRTYAIESGWRCWTQGECDEKK
jgi:hypothetical protein